MTRPITAAVAVVLAVSGALAFDAVGRSQAPTDDPALSVDPTGRVLHRFLTALSGSGDAKGEGNAPGPSLTNAPPTRPPPTPSFIYDPRRGADTAAKPTNPDGPGRPDREMPPLTDTNPVPRPRATESEIGVLPVAPPEVEPAGTAPEPTVGEGEPPPETEPPALPTAAEASDPALTSDALPPPTLGPEPSAEADIGSAAESPAETSSMTPDSIRPDTATEKDAELEYFETFNPSIVPHKRGRALNSVDENFALTLIRGTLRPVRKASMEDVAAARRDIFTAEAVVEARGDEAIPMPSVSSDDRLLSWEAIPPQELVFLRDDGDNLYVRLSKPGRATVRWRLAAPHTYFARSPDAARRLNLGAVPAAVRPQPSAIVRQQARDVARALGIGLTGSLGRTLDALILYFRSFTPGEPPPERAGIYKDLALGQVGVCRHRAFAFVATAVGLGVPARYVYNEAHVFVEVWLPADAEGPAGWTRVDLGGGAQSLDIHGGRDKTLHRPPEDAFPVPPNFDRDAIAGAAEVRGLPPQAPPQPVIPDDVAEASSPTPQEAPRGSKPSSDEQAFWGDMEASLEKNLGPVAPSVDEPKPEPELDTRAAAPWLWPASSLWPALNGDPAPGGNEPSTVAGELEPRAVDGREGTTVAVTLHAADVTRGQPFRVDGTVVSADDAPAPDGFVQILVVRAPTKVDASATPWLIGAARLNERGQFEATVSVPPALPPGAYDLVVEYPGNTRFRPSVGR